MWLLEKNTVCDYLKQHYPQFDQSGEVTVRSIGDPSEAPKMDEAGGFVNNIFRVGNGTSSLIVKQGQEGMRINSAVKLPSIRNRMECESMRIRSAMVPQYVPEVYYVDLENSIFLMEDVSYLGAVRYQLCQGVQLPLLAQQVGEYVAVNAFYTSEFYMDPDQFRKLSAYFRNSEMRAIMEDWVFLGNAKIPEEEDHPPMDANSLMFEEMVKNNQALRARVHELRHKYMFHTEGFVHGDLHISNMFADQTRLKIIDMEYTFAGPLCYDVGYFANSLLGQYCTAVFREFPSEAERSSFITYTLTSLCQVYNTFVEKFKSFWAQDAKEVYRKEPAYCQLVVDSFLADILGYAAIPSMNATHYMVVPEYNMMEPAAKAKAQNLSLIFCQQFLLNGNRYKTMEEVVVDMMETTKAYCKQLP